VMGSIQTKKILITAKNSYIGNSFAAWVADRPEYTIDFISCRTDEWKKRPFSNYDVVLHVAGIAHIKETKKNADLYYKINRDLTIELAEKAKQEGVKQFIFLSSMSVYGIEHGVITKETIPNPKSSYGISKLQAEEQLISLEDDNFITTILRPPMVYGKNCRGNYKRLAKLATIVPVFPNISNQRSMIYIDNLSEFLVQMIINNYSGIYNPQNSEYVCVSDLVGKISNLNDKRVVLFSVGTSLVSYIANKNSTLRKIFGTLIYKQEDFSNHCVVSFNDSLTYTEKK